MTDIVEALQGLLRHVDINTCLHEETKRGGTIWTICCYCGRKWADDEGGFQPHVDAPAVAAARRALTTPIADPYAASYQLGRADLKREIETILSSHTIERSALLD